MTSDTLGVLHLSVISYGRTRHVDTCIRAGMQRGIAYVRIYVDGIEVAGGRDPLFSDALSAAAEAFAIWLRGPSLASMHAAVASMAAEQSRRP